VPALSLISFLIGLFALMGLFAAQSAPQETVFAVLGVGFWLISAVLGGAAAIRSAVLDLRPQVTASAKAPAAPARRRRSGRPADERPSG
jgi:disulfide bond formation protein DsbB